MKCFLAIVVSVLSFGIARSGVIPPAVIKNSEQDDTKMNSNDDKLIFSHIVSTFIYHLEIVSQKISMEQFFYTSILNE